MAKRRGNSEGTIYELKDGRWRSQVTLDGRRLSHSAKTRRECEEWRKRMISQIDAGLTYASTRMTLQGYMTNWLSDKKASLRQTTWTHYKHVTDRYITPGIGHIKLINLRSDQIQGLYNRLLAQRVGIPTVRKIHTVLHSALSHSVKTGGIVRNPASATLPPKAPSVEMKYLDENQVNQLLVATKVKRLEALYHLALTTGMRQMEILGLKWTDLDWINQSIKVERQLERPVGEGIKFAPLKTKFSKRLLPLGKMTIEGLEAHHERQQMERQSAGDKWTEHGLIFTNSLGGPIHPRNLLRSFKLLLEKAGLPEIRFHDLRHSCAALWLSHGIPLIVASRRLGHARASITLDVYGHLLPSMQIELADKIDELVTPVELHRIAPKLHRNLLRN